MSKLDLIQNLFSPEKQIESIPSQASFADPHRKKKTPKLYPILPTHIARKVQVEDVLDDKPEKQNPHQLRLGQISEEPCELNQILNEEYSGYQSKRNDSFSAAKKNIFSTDSLHSSKYQELIKGPVIRNGKLVRHSIVGTTELFDKQQRKKQSQLHGKHHDTENSFSISDLTMSTHRANTHVSNLMPSSSHSRLSPGTSKKIEPVRKEVKKEPKVSREQLLELIDQMKERQNKFYYDIDRASGDLKTSDRLYFTKEKRILDRYVDTQDHWDKTIQYANTLLGRSPTESVAVKADEYREKRERAETFEVIKSDEERHGILYWYMALRKFPGLKDVRGAIVQDDLPAGFKTGMLDSSRGPLEIIRKPKSLASILTSPRETTQITQNTISTIVSNRSSMHPKASERTEREYSMIRMLENQRLIDKVKANLNDGEDLLVLYLNFFCNCDIIQLAGW